MPKHANLVYALFFISNTLLSNTVIVEERLPTVKEIEELFQVAIDRPNQSRIVASVTIESPTWSSERIEQEVNRQTVILKKAGSKREPTESLLAARRAAIAKAHSGTRKIVAEEYRHGSYIRTDLTDYGLSTDEAFIKSSSYMMTHVDIHDPSFSEYSKYNTNHYRKLTNLTKGASTPGYKLNLMEAITLNQILSRPITKLIGKNFDAKSSNDRSSKSSLSLISLIDMEKVKLLSNGQSTDVKLTVSDTTNQDSLITKYHLSAKMPSENGTTIPVVAEYWLKKVHGRPFLLKGTYRNTNNAETFFTERKNFGNDGYPMFVYNALNRANGTHENISIQISQIDTNPQLDVNKIFKPEAIEGYKVVEYTGSQGKIISGGGDKDGKKLNTYRSPTERRRMIVLSLLAIVPMFFLIPLIKKAIARLYNRYNK